MTMLLGPPAGRALLSLALTCVLALTVTGPVAGQAPAAAEDAVREVVGRLFDGMRRGDSTAVRSVFHPDARMLTAVVSDGQPVVRSASVDDFVRAVGTPHDEIWDERIGEMDVRVDDPMATAWMTYRFHLGRDFSHCGVNAMQFARTPTGWQIVQIMDTRRRTC